VSVDSTAADVNRREVAVGTTATLQDRAIPVRRLDVDFDAIQPRRHLIEDDKFQSHLLAALSAVFPVGEDFFVDAVKAYRRDVADHPRLRPLVKGFIGQESMHGREHRELNERLAQLGYPTAAIERGIGVVLALLKQQPRSMQLSVTAAAEHLTATIAHTILVDEGMRELFAENPELGSLLEWHAVEELEHKDVAFDLLAEVDGRYAVRAAGMAVAAATLGAYVVAAVAVSMATDRRRIRPREVPRLLHNLRRQQLLSARTLARSVRYLRPGFHPNDDDTEPLLEAARAAIAGYTSAGLAAS
jgi:predicted metal-dependent hydrolase